MLTPDTIIPDSTNPQSYNRYSYVQNNPLNRIDPTGHIDCSLLSGEDSAACVQANTIQNIENTMSTVIDIITPDIWLSSPVDNPDWVQFYGHTEYTTRRLYNTNEGQHPGLDYGIYAQSFGGTYNNKTNQWEFDGTYGSTGGIPVYAGCYCTVESITTESYAPGRVNLTHEALPDSQLIYGHLQDIQVSAYVEVTPDTIIGYLDTSERHVHIEIRNSDNEFVNPYPYLSKELQVDFASFQGDSSNTTYRSNYPNNMFLQSNGFYKE